MAKKYEIEITAKDKTQAAVAQVNKNFEALVKGTALEEHHKRLSSFGERGRAVLGIVNGFRQMGLHARAGALGVQDLASAHASLGQTASGQNLDSVAKGFSAVNDNSRAAATGVADVGSAAEGVEATGGGIEATAGALGLLGAAAGPVSLAVGVVAAGLGEAGKKAGEFADESAKVGFSTDRLAKRLDVNAQTLQQYQIAGKQAGVSAEGMNQAFAGLGKTLEDAGAGRNQAAERLISRLGISVHRLKDGSIDTADAMDQLGHAMQGKNAEARDELAGIFSVTSATDFLIQTDNIRKAQLEEAAKSGAIRGQKQLDDETKLHQSELKLADAWEGLKNRLTENFIIPWLQPTLDEMLKLTGALHDIDEGPEKAGLPTSNSREGIGAIDGPKAREAMAYFEKQGWSRERAAGIVANIFAESGFNEKAVGDGGHAYGIGQWHEDRQREFKRYTGADIRDSSWAQQLAFYQYEMTHGQRQRTGADLWKAKDAASAAGVVSREFEAPADVNGEAARRGAIADHLVHIEISHAPGLQVATSSSSAKITTGARVNPSVPGPAT